MSAVTKDDAVSTEDLEKFAAAARAQVESGATLDLVVGNSRCKLSGANALRALAVLARSSDEVGSDDWITTGQAADILGVSRPTVVGLVDSGKIPATRVGTHRRISLTDLITFQDASRAQTSDALDELVSLSADLGLYDA